MNHKFDVTVCVAIFPPPIQCIPLLNLTELLGSLTHAIYVISSRKSLRGAGLARNVRVIEVDHKASLSVFMRIINYVHTQLKILCHVIAVSKRVDLFVFFIGGEGLLIPLVTLRLLRKKVVLMPAGVGTRVLSIKKDPLSKLMPVLVNLNLSLADRIIVYSRRLVREGNFTKYQRKILFTHEHFVDFTRFMLRKRIDQRLNMVGYIGRLSEEKGILNLIESVPLVLKKRASTRFVICGEGSLADEVEKIIKTEGLEAHVKLTGWIPHEAVPQYLNELKLLVLPSFTEGLPNILLEAMASGTPVLATPVGAVTDIIKNRETGFLLASNDPKHIADRIVELLSKPDLLEKVSINAYRWVRENFSEEKTLDSWRRIFQEPGTFE